MFGELWSKCTLMMNLDREIDKQDSKSQSFLTHTKKLNFNEGGSILKASTYVRKKESELSHVTSN